MTPRLIPADRDPVGRSDRPLTITVDGESVHGVAGQTLAAVLLAADRPVWRTAPTGGGRGVFCGIGVCFDCVATVNGRRDVRLCRRPALDGDVVATQSRFDRPRADPTPPAAPDASPTTVVATTPRTEDPR